MPTIPISSVVTVNPSVLPAGGNALNLNGLVLTTNTRVPIGAVLSFATAAAVLAFFGGGSKEASYASTYFAGFDGSNVKPGAMLFAQYPLAAVSAYLRGGNISALTLTQLQAISGTLNVTIDSVLKTGSVNLAAATSFTGAAQIIESTLAISGASQGTVTATIAATVMTVSAVLTGTNPIQVGDKITGAGVTANTFVASFGTGTGGAGTYNVTQTSAVGPITMTSLLPAVSFDSVSGAFTISSGTTGAASTITVGSGAIAASLLLTAATGAVLSQGAIAAVPATFMTALAIVTQNWATFTTSFDPDQGAGNAQKLALAAWTSGQNARYGYVASDSDINAATLNPAPASLGALIAAAGYSGTCLVWQPSDLNLAPFVLGAVASIDFTQVNGRITFDFKKQSGLTPGVTDLTTATNLVANGYNFYGAYATANQSFQWFSPGSVSGPFQWLDTFVNQISLSSALQLALTIMLTQNRSIPYNAQGQGIIGASLNDTIQQYLLFGAYRAGVVLSSNQVANVNSQAGKNIASTLSNQGWYLQVGVALPAVRQARGSPPITFWFVDGEAVQNINLASIVLQ